MSAALASASNSVANAVNETKMSLLLGAAGLIHQASEIIGSSGGGGPAPAETPSQPTGGSQGGPGLGAGAAAGGGVAAAVATIAQDPKVQGTLESAAKGLPPLRQQYVDAVRSLISKAQAMRDAGASVEEMARDLHAERRALGVQFKDLTPPDKLAEMTARNIEKYGDKLGPTIDWLRDHHKSWEQIAESATNLAERTLGSRHGFAFVADRCAWRRVRR